MKAPNLEMKERQMLELLTEGASTRVIAKKMGYSEGTVRVYLHNMYKKLGVKNRTEALLWQLEHGRGVREAPAPMPRPAVVRADETFGDVALRDGLLCTLGVMESFIGPYGRIWEVGARLKDAPLDEVTIGTRDDARLLWRALLSGSFALGKSLHDEGRAERWVESSPSEAVLLACLLLIGGYSHAGEALMGQVSRSRKGSRPASGREIALLRGVRGALYADDDEAVSAVHHLAAERTTNPVVKHMAIVALYYIHRQRKDPARARETANVLWAEAESARRQLEAMGVRPLSREAGLPRPGRAVARGARERVATGD